ncbi:MAG: undecaprenyldiphospho-muramoylpentapeptide beta-N-acetylglucosaminyltransferase, partial [Bacteroidetes bacterium]|nr:undecaprenyldiphospho-muramoylpentapeptide beta-N-acetylglucosaminyltransferase [Candidatus Enterocola intestinipullorum]
MKQPRFIISGGGTGGHIFPAISIANTIKAHVPDAEILFVGAENRMEMEKVPAAGYKITGLPVSGLKRSLSPENIKVVINLFRSIRMAKKIIADFKPDAVIGVGGYASAPVLYAAAKKGIPTLIQEQNSYAGVTNKILGKKVDKVCVAYDGMEKFFPAAKIVKTGNPVRQQLALSSDKRDEAYGYFNFDPSKKTLLVVGGSLGARTINQSVLRKIDLLYKNHAADMQVIWQTGKFYIDEIREAVKNLDIKNMYITDFVSRMDLAYCIADLVISRAGASSISELSLLGKASILVPSPNVAEDHQTKNALALKNRNAAELIPDREARDRLVQESIRIVNNEAILSEYRRNIKYFSRPDAAEDIVSEVFALAGIEFVKKKKHETAKHAAHKTEKKNDTHGSIAEER